MKCWVYIEVSWGGGGVGYISKAYETDLVLSSFVTMSYFVCYIMLTCFFAFYLL